MSNIKLGKLEAPALALVASDNSKVAPSKCQNSAVAANSAKRQPRSARMACTSAPKLANKTGDVKERAFIAETLSDVCRQVSQMTPKELKEVARNLGLSQSQLTALGRQVMNPNAKANVENSSMPAELKNIFLIMIEYLNKNANAQQSTQIVGLELSQVNQSQLQNDNKRLASEESKLEKEQTKADKQQKKAHHHHWWDFLIGIVAAVVVTVVFTVLTAGVGGILFGAADAAAATAAEAGTVTAEVAADAATETADVTASTVEASTQTTAEAGEEGAADTVSDSTDADSVDNDTEESGPSQEAKTETQIDEQSQTDAEQQQQAEEEIDAEQKASKSENRFKRALNKALDNLKNNKKELTLKGLKRSPFAAMAAVMIVSFLQQGSVQAATSDAAYHLKEMQAKLQEIANSTNIAQDQLQQNNSIYVQSSTDALQANAQFVGLFTQDERQMFSITAR